MAKQNQVDIAGEQIRQVSWSMCFFFNNIKKS